MSYLAIKIGAWAISGLAAFTLLWGASKPPERQLQPGEQITTTLISIVPTLPETTTTTTSTSTTTLPVYSGLCMYFTDTRGSDSETHQFLFNGYFIGL
jgi:hypothetical protein